MRHQRLLVACLFGSALASPLPPRVSPIIGVVVPSNLVDIPKYGMGDSIERAAPSPVSTSTSVTAVVPTVPTSTSTATSSSTTAAATNEVVLIPGNRYQGSGNVASTSSYAAEIAVGMGEAVSRPRPAKDSPTVTKRDSEDGTEIVELECVEYEDGTRECTGSSD